MLSHVDWFVLLLASEEAKRENVLSHVDWSALQLGSEEKVRMVSAAFYFARGGDLSRMASVILIGRNSKLQRPKQFPH